MLVMAKLASNSTVQPCRPPVSAGTVMLPMNPESQLLLTL
jgi:hypothetical protein